MSDLHALSQVFMICKNTELQFLSMLIHRLKTNIPEFDTEMLVTHMQIMQEKWPITDPDEVVAGQARVGLAFWADITEAVESGVASALH